MGCTSPRHTRRVTSDLHDTPSAPQGKMRSEARESKAIWPLLTSIRGLTCTFVSTLPRRWPTCVRPVDVVNGRGVARSGGVEEAGVRGLIRRATPCAESRPPRRRASRLIGNHTEATICDRHLSDDPVTGSVTGATVNRPLFATES